MTPKSRLDETLADLNAVLERRPGEYRALIDVGYLGLQHPRVPVGSDTLGARGKTAIAHLRSLDPAHPQGLFLASEYAFRDGQADEAIELLRSLGKRAHGPVARKIAQLSRLMQNSELPAAQRMAYAKVSLALRRLRRELPPE